VRAAEIGKIAQAVQYQAKPIIGVHRRGAKYDANVDNGMDRPAAPSLTVNAAGVNEKSMMPTFESSAEATNIWPKNDRREVVFIGRSLTAVL
jgi:hypothetical protein